MTKEEKALVTVSQAITTKDYQDEIEMLQDFVKKGMHEGYDYGVHPGTTTKTLKKPGAEKLLKKFGLVPEFILEKEIVEMKESFCYYKYRCRLIHFKSGNFAGEAVRSCNSKEPFFNKRVIRSGIYDVLSDVEAKAQKRALVAATHTATMAGEIFYDAEDDDRESTRGTPPDRTNPERMNLVKKMFAVGKNKGLSPDEVKQLVYEKYGVESSKDITNKQIADFSDWIVSEYQKSETIEPEAVEVETVEVVDVKKKTKCYNCKEKPIDPKLGYYCSQECMDTYYKPKTRKSYSFG